MPLEDASLNLSWSGREPVAAIIEARTASTRLPGKVLLDLAGKPSLERLVERVRRSRLVDRVVVATTTNPEDEAIESLCRTLGCDCFRGSQDDVLARVLGAARAVEADLIVELTGDCPLIDHRHIDQVIRLFHETGCDYAANTVERTFPDGFDVQVFSRRLLEEVDRLTDDPVDRVHVSYYIYTRPGQYRLANWPARADEAWPELRVTLDEERDYLLLKAVFDRLYPVNPDFSAREVIDLLRAEPGLRRINQQVMAKKPEDG